MLGKGEAGRARSTGRGNGRNLEKLPRVGGHLYATTIKSDTQRKRLTQNAGPRQSKIVAGRVRAEDAVDSRTIKTTVQAHKDKGSVYGLETPGIQENMHNDTDGSKTKEERCTPRPKDGDRITGHRQDVPGTRPFEGQHAPQGPQDQDADSLSNPNSAGALSLEPTSSPAQVRQRGEEPAPVK